MFNTIRLWWTRLSDRYRDRRDEWRVELADSPAYFRILGIALAVYAFIVVILGFYWSMEPEQFSVREKLAQQVQSTGQVSATGQPSKAFTGQATTTTLIDVAGTLLDKPGGFLSNDVLPPGLLLDNMPSWEYGVLIQTRDMAKAMREAFSRSQSQSTEDQALALAESRFNFDHKSWVLPASESEYEDGIKQLQDYLDRLVDEDETNAQFFARSDNLRYWLSTVETRLGSLSQRLSASVGQRRLNTDLANTEVAGQSTEAPSEFEVKTPWLETDNVFYEARGSTWAIVHFLKAIEIDFEDVLRKKNALVSLQQIIRELEAAQQPVYSPVILNGSGFGLLANHSLVMASYISRANAAIIDLRDLLSQG